MPDFDVVVGADTRPAEQKLTQLSQMFDRQFKGGINAKAFTRPLGEISGKASEFQKSLDASNARVLAFGASAGSIYALKSAFEKLISTTVEVEKSIVDINAIFGLGSSQLKTFTANLFNVANQTGETFKDATEAAVLFARQGLSVEETLKRTAAALTLSKISGLDFADSVTSITSILNGFSKEALDAATVLDRLTAVDSQFAVSAGTLAEALKRVGSSAEDANVTFNQTISLITAAAQITGRTGGVIGNTFKTIFSKVQRPEVLDQLEEVGVAVKDMNGKILPTMTILSNLSRAYQGLSSSQKSFVSQAVGGLYQINVLKAVLGDMGSQLSIVARAQNAVANSTGIVQHRMDSLNSTMAAGILRTMNDLTQATSNVGNILTGSLVKGTTSQLSTALQFVSQQTDPNNKSASAQTAQGLIKGFGNVLSGPALQGISTVFAKLILNLEKFVKESYQDILGTNAAMKERAAIEEKVINWLGQENELVQDILKGTVSINEARQQYLGQFNSGVRGFNTATTMAGPIASYVMEKGLTTSKVPNAFDPVADALYRENKMTGGHARLDSHPSLVTPSNPYGLVAIDTRTQASAADAIMQHKAHGQPLSSITANYTSRTSFIPNLAVGDNLTTSMLLGFGSLTAMGGVNQDVNKWISKYPTMASIFASTTDLEIAKKKQLVAEYDSTIKNFLTANEKIKQTFGGVTFSNAAEMGRHPITQDINNLRQEVQKTESEQLRRQNDLSRFGFRGAMGASVLGGFASQFASNLSPTAGASVDQLNTGVTEAFQSIMALPKKLGKSLAAGFVAGGIFNALDTFSKKMEDAQANYEQQLDKDKALMETTSGLIQTISNLNGMFIDTSVSQEDIVKANQNYVSTLAKLAQLEGGQDLVTKIMATASPQGQMDVISQFQIDKTNQMNQASALIGSQKNWSQFSGVFNRNVGYSYSTDFDKSSTQSLLADTAAAAIGGMSEDLKNALMANLGSGDHDKFKMLALASPLVQQVTMQGGSKATNQLVQEIGGQLMFQKLNNSPEMQEAIDTSRKKAQAAQIELDNAVRYQQYLQKLALNQGAAAVQNIEYLQGYTYTSGHNARLAAINLAQQGAALFGETHGVRETAMYNYRNSAEELHENYRAQQHQITTEANTYIGESIRKMGGFVDEYLHNSMSSQPTLAGQHPQELGDYSKQFLQGINTGFQNVFAQAKGDVFNKYRGTNGQFDLSAFASAIANQSGVLNPTIRGNIQSFMQSNPDEKFLETLNDYSKQGLDATVAVKQAILQKGQETIEALSRADFDQQVAYLGGIKDLLDRQQRRGEERKLIRGETLMNNPNLPPEMQARGAAMVLDYYRDNGMQRDANGNINPDALRARNIFLQNESSYLQTEAQRVGGQIGGLGGQVMQAGPYGGWMQAAESQANQQWGFTNTSQTGPLAGQTPPNDKDVQAVITDIQGDQDKFVAILNKFPDALKDTIAKLEDAYKAVDIARGNLSNVQSQGQSDIEAQFKKLIGTMDTFYSQEVQLNKGGNQGGFKGFISEYSGPIIQAAVMSAFGAIFNRGGGLIKRLWTGERPSAPPLPSEGLPNVSEPEEPIIPTGNGNGNGNGSGRRWMARRPAGAVAAEAGEAAGNGSGLPGWANGNVRRLARNINPAVAEAPAAATTPFVSEWYQKNGQWYHEAYKPEPPVTRDAQGRFVSGNKFRIQPKPTVPEITHLERQRIIRMGMTAQPVIHSGNEHILYNPSLTGRYKVNARPLPELHPGGHVYHPQAPEEFVGPHPLPEEHLGGATGKALLTKSTGALDKEYAANVARVVNAGKNVASRTGKFLTSPSEWWSGLKATDKLVSGSFESLIASGGNVPKEFVSEIGATLSTKNWGALSKLGKIGKIGGVAGIALSGVNLYNDVKNAQTWQDYVGAGGNFANNMLAFAGPIGRIGSAVNWGAKWAVNKGADIWDMNQETEANNRYLAAEEKALPRLQAQERKKHEIGDLQKHQSDLITALNNLNKSVISQNQGQVEKGGGVVITLGNITVNASTWQDALLKINDAMQKQYQDLQNQIERIQKPNAPPKVKS